VGGPIGQKPYLNIIYTTAPPYSEKGLVNITKGATPFYINSTNIYGITAKNPVNITLDKDQSQIVTFYTNATGDYASYEFFIYANKTSEMAISNTTTKWNVTIS